MRFCERREDRRDQARPRIDCIVRREAEDRPSDDLVEFREDDGRSGFGEVAKGFDFKAAVQVEFLQRQGGMPKTIKVSSSKVPISTARSKVPPVDGSRLKAVGKEQRGARHATTKPGRSAGPRDPAVALPNCGASVPPPVDGSRLKELGKKQGLSGPALTKPKNTVTQRARSAPPVNADSSVQWVPPPVDGSRLKQLGNKQRLTEAKPKTFRGRTKVDQKPVANSTPLVPEPTDGMRLKASSHILEKDPPKIEVSPTEPVKLSTRIHDKDASAKKCTECGEISLVLYKYLETSKGTVSLCELCNADALDRSFGQDDLLEHAGFRGGKVAANRARFRKWKGR